MKDAGAWFGLVVAMMILCPGSRAEDEAAVAVSAPDAAAQSSGVVPMPTASMPAPGRPRGVAPGAIPAAVRGSPSAPTASKSAPTSTGRPPAAVDPPAAGSSGGDQSSAPAGFVTEEKWGMAGYNSNEPIYTILITSHDPRIIRCTADLKGTYIENGERFQVTDRQTTTVFPNTQVQIGNWSGMDQQSGAVYAVKCRPV